MANQEELDELRAQLAALTTRVYRLEVATQTNGPTAERRAPATSGPPAVPDLVFTEADFLAGRTGHPLPPPPPPSAPTLRIGGGAASQKRVSEERPGLEQRIGSEVLNRIGLVALLFGISYFLKYAFDNNWIGPAGRVVIGLLAGIAVVVWSESFRRKGYLAFSWSLKAVGIGAMYLSLWAAFQLYHLVPAGLAFAAMVAVTAATVVLALRQDAEILAAFALAGGFLTPVLISTGENKQLELFSYVALLNLGTLMLVRVKPWSRLLIGSFTGTLILYVGWFAAFYDVEQRGSTLFFATLFFAIFAAVPLLTRVSEEEKITLRNAFQQLLLVLPLANAAVFFLQIFAIFDEKSNRNLLTLVALALAAFYLGMNRLLRNQAGAGAPKGELLAMLHAGIAVAFLTISIPLKLESHWITIGWLVESAVLLWIGYRGESALLARLGVVALALALLRLLAVDNFHSETLLWNARFATHALAAVILAGIAVGGRRTGDERTFVVATVAVNVLALLALNHEVHDFFQRRMVENQGGEPGAFREFRLARDFSYSAVWLAYGASVMVLGFLKREAVLRWQALLIIGITIGKVFLYDVAQLRQGYRIVSFIALGAVLMFISFIYQRDWLRLQKRAAAAGGGR